MKKMKIFRQVFPYALILILVIFDVIFLLSAKSTQILPAKYFAVLTALISVITFLICFLLFIDKIRHKEVKSKFKKITAYILTAVLVLISAMGSYVSCKFSNTLNSIASNQVTESFTGVYVLKDDPARTVEDLAGYDIGFQDFGDTYSVNYALKEMKNIIGDSLSAQGFDTVLKMADALYNGEIKALVTDISYIELLKEIDLYKDFSSKTKLVAKYSVLEKNEPVYEEDNKIYSVYDPFVVYLSGSDTRSTYLAKSRSDVNILAVVNFKTHQVLLVNTPRDYYVSNPAGNGALDKLTHCGIYGLSCSAQALADLYGCKVSYCAQINFTGFETLVDTIGGISVYSDVDMPSNIEKYSIKKGENHMNGDQALHYARDRYSYASGDNARGNHQMQIIKAIIQKMLQGKIITRYSEILESLEGMFNTDMSADVMAKLIQKQIEEMSKWDIFTYAVTGKGGSNTTYSMPGYKSYVMYPDEETVNKASNLINKVLESQIISQNDIG